MAVNIKLKRSNVAGTIPSPASLDLGELALNTADGKAFMKKSDGNVVEIGSPSSSLSASYANTAGFAITAGSASYSNISTTSSYSLVAVSSSFATTASYTPGSGTAVSSSYAATASSADNFLVRGTLTAQTIVAQYITSSTSFITGSTKFGILSSNTHEFTGSVSVSGSLSVSGSNVILTNQTSSMSVLSASYAFNATSASYVLTSSYAATSSIATSASYANNATSASYATQANSASYAISASQAQNATTASYVLNAVSASHALTSSYSNNISGTTNYLPKFTGANSLGNSIAYENATGIGINDTSPTHKFQVSGDAFIYNSNSTLNSTKYAFLPALNVTTTGTETNQWANVGIYGSLGFSATASTFTPLDKSFVSAFLGNVIKSGAGSVAGKMSSYAAASNFSGTGNVTTTAGFRAYAPLQSFALPTFTGTLTNYIGLLIDDITGTTDIGSQITNKYGIYQSGSLDKNYFAGATIFAGGFTGSLEGTSSYALTASYAMNGGGGGLSALYIQDEGVTQGTASYIDFTGPGVTATVTGGTASISIIGGGLPYISASFNGYVLTASGSTAAWAPTSSLSVLSASYALSSSYAIQTDNAVTASYVLNAVSSSFASTASFITLAQTASFVTTAQTSSLALTASSADNFLVRGTLTAQTINVQTITSSIDFVTGSTRFGTITTNTHQFTGSVSVSGSLAANGSNVILTNQTSSMSVATASFASTSSYVSGLNLAAITTGSIFASVDVDINNLFLIKSGSSTYFNIASNSNTTIFSDLFIIKNFTTQQPVLIVSQSIVQFATQSSAPTGTTTAGSIWFTSSSMYIGLE
jgi:hypothetical protein